MNFTAIIIAGLIGIGALIWVELDLRGPE